MSGSPWLARLKNGRAPEMAPTKPTKPLARDEASGFVGFAGADSGTNGKTLSVQGGGFIGFTGFESRANPNSHEPEAPVDIDGAEFPDQYARARKEPLAPSQQPSPGVEAFAQRVHCFTERGLSIESAEAFTGRLASRDADHDDRRLCLECSYLGAQGRCIAAATGRLPGASARLEPVQTILQRCDAFGLRKGLV